ncbi:hypothetical protein [uncultured Marinobacter sp.]|uniref:hypothetical protein n=1 Tax=uncultured Marinobacter sp. TaxID=187379 RepID=UPI0030D96BE8|tara:strand:+ start:137 stop:400 length:264 start_codon:yes stop_codon:yes gene_type:complete
MDDLKRRERSAELLARAIFVILVSAIVGLVARIWFGDSGGWIAFYASCAILGLRDKMIREAAVFLAVGSTLLVIAVLVVGWLIETGN